MGFGNKPQGKKFKGGKKLSSKDKRKLKKELKPKAEDVYLCDTFVGHFIAKPEKFIEFLKASHKKVAISNRNSINQKENNPILSINSNSVENHLEDQENIEWADNWEDNKNEEHTTQISTDNDNLNNKQEQNVNDESVEASNIDDENKFKSDNSQMTEFIKSSEVNPVINNIYKSNDNSILTNSESLNNINSDEIDNLINRDQTSKRESINATDLKQDITNDKNSSELTALQPNSEMITNKFIEIHFTWNENSNIGIQIKTIENINGEVSKEIEVPTLNNLLLSAHCSECHENNINELNILLKPLEWRCNNHLDFKGIYIEMKTLHFKCQEHKKNFGFYGLNNDHYKSDKAEKNIPIYVELMKILTNWINENKFSISSVIENFPLRIKETLGLVKEERQSIEPIEPIYINKKQNKLNTQISKIIPDKSFIQLDSEEYTFSKRGLMNLGNTCYMNSVLQCLLQIESMARFYLQFPKVNHKADENNEDNEDNEIDPCIGPMNQALTQFFREMFSKPNEPFKPRWILNQIADLAPHFRPGSQQDAHEFLRYLQMIASSEFPNSKNNIFENTFNMKIRTTVICLNCNKISTQTTDGIDLSIPLVNKKTNQISEKIKIFFEKEHNIYSEYIDYILNPELIYDVLSGLPSDEAHIMHCLWGYFRIDKLSDETKNGYLCEKCSIQHVENETESTKPKKITRPAYLQYSLETPPNILTIQLKRFELDAKKSKKSISKLDTQITIPSEIDLRPFFHQESEYLKSGASTKYQLISLVNHLGASLNSGHYVSYTKQLRLAKEDTRRGNYVFQSDSTIKGVNDENEVLNQQGYLLFYEKIESTE